MHFRSSQFQARSSSRWLWVGMFVYLLLVGYSFGPGKEQPGKGGVEPRAEARVIADAPKMNRAPAVFLPAQVRLVESKVQAPAALEVAVDWVYADDASAQIPEWIPKPSGVAAARVEEATLRSDGLKEGRVVLIFDSSSPLAVERLKESIQVLGLSEVQENQFETKDGLRRCFISVRADNQDRIHATLSYADRSHAEGCHCPSCGGDEPS